MVEAAAKVGDPTEVEALVAAAVEAVEAEAEAVEAEAEAEAAELPSDAMTCQTPEPRSPVPPSDSNTRVLPSAPRAQSRWPATTSRSPFALQQHNNPPAATAGAAISVKRGDGCCLHC